MPSLGVAELQRKPVSCELRWILGCLGDVFGTVRWRHAVQVFRRHYRFGSWRTGVPSFAGIKGLQRQPLPGTLRGFMGCLGWVHSRMWRGYADEVIQYDYRVGARWRRMPNIARVSQLQHSRMPSELCFRLVWLGRLFQTVRWWHTSQDHERPNSSSTRWYCLSCFPYFAEL